MINYLSQFLLLQNIDKNLSRAEIDKTRAQVTIKLAIALFPIWAIFDYALDPRHFSLFISLRLGFACFALIALLFLKSTHDYKKIIAIGVSCYSAILIALGIMMFYTDHFLPYALGMSTTFIIPSIILTWKPRYSLTPAALGYFLAVIPAGLFRSSVPSADAITGLFWTGSILATSCIFSFVNYRYVNQVIDLTENLQDKVKEKTLELHQKNIELDIKNNELNQKNAELAESNKKLETSNSKLQDLDKRKNEFLANTSHELRTPLHGIMGLAQFLIKTLGPKISADQLENLKLIHQSGSRLNYLINDILDFSKMRENNVELMITEVNISVLMKNLLILLMPQMVHQNLVLMNELPDDLPTVLADEHRMQQILYNLMGNAIKFTPKGFIRIHAEIESGFLMLFITDTGIGIPSHKMDLIFDAFEQVDGSTSRQYGGTGLGLSVTKQLVELHKGTLGVKSSIGEGSCFYFSVPLADTSQTHIHSHHSSHVQLIESPSPEFIAGKINPQIQQSFQRLQLLPQATVLVVDDDGLNIGVTKNFLTSIGAKVITANSGKSALSLLNRLEEEQLPNLVLLDVMMPGMNGYEVAQAIRTHISTTLPIVILTTLKEDSATLYQGFAAGVNDFLSKPYDETELFMRLESVLHSQTFLKEPEETEEFV